MLEFGYSPELVAVSAHSIQLPVEPAVEFPALPVPVAFESAERLALQIAAGSGIAVDSGIVEPFNHLLILILSWLICNILF
jgi:hypothetical protein